MSVISYDTSAAIMRVIDRISQGETPTRACKNERMAVATLQKYAKTDSVIGALFEEAMQIGHDTLADSLINLADLQTMTGAADEKELKIASDNIKWYLARRNTRYNERVVVEHNHTADKAVIEALTKGKQRAFERSAAVAIEDAQYEIVEDDPLAEFR
jgi:hypothetical protein